MDTSELLDSRNDPQPVPVVDDMSIFLIAGRVKQSPAGGYEAPGQYSPSEFSPVKTQALDAERLGFRGVWLSERFNLKEAGAVLGGAAAITSRIAVGTGALAASSRHPVVTAAIGATINASYGPRFILGLGRGDSLYYSGHGFTENGRVSTNWPGLVSEYHRRTRTLSPEDFLVTT